MSSVRYKKLLANLPSMASIVNSFQSPEVQVQVYETLIGALEEGQDWAKASSRIMQKSGSAILANGDVETDLVEGDSIHSLGQDVEE